MIDGGELFPPDVRDVPPFASIDALDADAPPLGGVTIVDAGALLGLDPWPPRRTLNVLQRARVAMGLSQNELAVEVGVSRQTVSSIENRRRVPSVQIALAIAAALHGTVEELFPAKELSP